MFSRYTTCVRNKERSESEGKWKKRKGKGNIGKACISILYAAENWEKLRLRLIERKKKKRGARVRDPLRYFRAALGSGLVQKYVNACVACPWILKSCFLEANPHLLFLFRRASPLPPSFHASIGSRKNTGTCYGQHVPPLPKNSPLGM